MTSHLWNVQDHESKKVHGCFTTSMPCLTASTTSISLPASGEFEFSLTLQRLPYPSSMSLSPLVPNSLALTAEPQDGVTGCRRFRVNRHINAPAENSMAWQLLGRHRRQRIPLAVPVVFVCLLPIALKQVGVYKSCEARDGR